jgi:lipopolysaccharide export system permease protein
MVAAVAVAVLVCTGLLLLGNLLKEILGLLMSGQATLGLVLRGIGLLIPFVMAFALPMGALTAALLVYGRLSADQELTAARANGIGLISLSVPALLLSLLLCGVCAWVNLDVAPRCRVAYKNLFREIAQERARNLIVPGRFLTESPGVVLYAGHVEGDVLEDVLFFMLRDGRKWRDVRAPRARIEMRAEERELKVTFEEARILEWVPRSVADTNAPAGEGQGGGQGEGEGGTWQPGTGGMEATMKLPPALGPGGLPAYSDMTFQQLMGERRELLKLGMGPAEVGPIDVQLHRLAAFSFATFGFALIGVPLGVRAHRRETSVGIAMAIGLVLLYYGFLIVAQALETKPEAAAWVIVWMPNVLFQSVGAWLLWRVNRGK